MKKIVCELCEGMEFTKIDGMFVCNECGTRYSLEEAKAMMKEIDGEVAVNVTPTVQPTVQPVDNSKQLENILVLATTAYEAENYQEAENYCNRAIEIDATSYKAWFLKGKAVGWSSKLDSMRVEEAAHSFCKALDCAPEQEKEGLKNEAVTVLKDLGIAAISLRKKRFAQSPDADELAGFSKDRKALIDALLVLLRHGNLVAMPEGYLAQIATMMNDAAVEAVRNSREKWRKITYPTDKDLTTYLEWNGHCEELLRQAIKVCEDDDDQDVTRYENLIMVLEDPIGKWSYTQEWNSYTTSYQHVKSKSLSDSAVAVRKKQVQQCRDAIAKIKKAKREKEDAERKQAAEEKKARVDAYWSAHQEEKAALDAEYAALQEEKKTLDEKIAEYNAKITATKKEGAEKVPAELDQDDFKKEMSALIYEKADLGIFKVKEKKELDDKIEMLRIKIEALDAKVKTQKEELQKATHSRYTALRQEMKPLEERKKEIMSRMAEIETEFEMDR